MNRPNPVRCLLVKVLGLAIAAWSIGLPSRAIAEPATFETKIRPLLASYCFKCHGEQKKKGGLDLEKFKSDMMAGEPADFWETIAERLVNREMPPDGSEQPTDAERAELLGWMKELPKQTGDCRRLATDANQHFYRGYVMSRRLNRVEYANSIRDLFGIDLKPAEGLPADGSGGEGFNTAGAALFVSEIHLEKYLDAADAVLNVVLADDAGPTLPDEIAAARKRIHFALPEGDSSPRDAARKIVAPFAERAFRRPVSAAEADRLLTMFDRAQDRGDSFIASVRLALKAVLISPHFLFLIEPEPEAEGVYRLSHFQLASRLSYFLWSSLPDEELLSLASAERLHEDEVLRQQVRRMLKDPRSRALAENFATQWLGIDALNGTVRPDPSRFPEFDHGLADDMRAEAVRAFDYIVREDRSLLEFLDADYTFLNERLAKHYGIAGVEGGEMRRVELTDRNRGGVLGFGSVLTATSYPLRTSPVLRGKWVLEAVLGGRVPPPPPAAGTLPADDAPVDGLTFRSRLELHRTKAECASCHQRMDPLGFGLENFDAIGRWRTEQAGQPVDASGKLPSGEHFDGPHELKAMLMARKREFLRNFSRKMFGYAMGREVNKFDRCVIDDSVKALEANHYRPSTLVEQIVLSYPFQYRYAKK